METRGWETRDVPIRPIVIFGAILVALVLGAVVLSSLVAAFYAGREQAASPPAHPLAPAVGTAVPPAPRLQAAPRKDLERLRAEEDAILESWGWVDRSAGVARIPIDRAMALLAERAARKGAR